MAFTAAILGLGNIGRCVLRAIELVPDCTCVGVVRRQTSIGTTPYDLRGVPDFPSFDDLCEHVEKPDVVIMGLPSRLCPGAAGELLSRGFCTVDSFDIHDRIVEVVGHLENAAIKGHAVAVTAAGWDPGTDSVQRALFERKAHKRLLRNDQLRLFQRRCNQKIGAGAPLHGGGAVYGFAHGQGNPGINTRHGKGCFLRHGVSPCSFHYGAALYKARHL